jgi:hypothetical protein
MVVFGYLSRPLGAASERTKWYNSGSVQWKKGTEF